MDGLECKSANLSPISLFASDRLILQYSDSLSLEAIYHFDLANAVPLDGEATFADIAKSCSMDEAKITRLIRHAITNRIFYEPRPGFVSHTAASRLLAKDQQMRDWVGMNLEDFVPANSKVITAMEQFPFSEEPSESGFVLANNETVPMFIILGKNKTRAKRFGGAMASLTEGKGYAPSYLVKGYPWQNVGSGTVVDVCHPLRNQFSFFQCFTTRF
jgi:hypothetical protein